MTPRCFIPSRDLNASGMVKAGKRHAQSGQGRAIATSAAELEAICVAPCLTRIRLLRSDARTLFAALICKCIHLVAAIRLRRFTFYRFDH